MLRNEQVDFRITDHNGSRFIVEEQVDQNKVSSYRIAVETRAGHCSYFYATQSQYQLFIQSEADRLHVAA